jgi:hypothetical protein
VPSNAILPENTGDLHLDNIEADAPGQGWGRAAMRLLTDLADRHGLAIYLRAAVGAEDGIEIEGGPIDQEALEDFYAKFGFIDTGSWGCRDMLRRPKPFEVDAQDRLRHAFAGRPVWQVKPEATSRPSP